MKIVAIDFETANYSPVSMCAVGLATFEQGQLTESKHWLVEPPNGLRTAMACSGSLSGTNPSSARSPARSWHISPAPMSSSPTTPLSTFVSWWPLWHTSDSAYPPYAARAPAHSLGECGRSWLTISAERWQPTLGMPFSIITPSPMPGPPAACCWQS